MTGLQRLTERSDPQSVALLEAVVTDEAAPYGTGWSFRSSATLNWLKDLPHDQLRSALLSLFAEKVSYANILNDTTPYQRRKIVGACLSHFARMKLGWRPDEVIRVLTEAAPLEFAMYSNVDDFRFAIGLAEQLDTLDQATVDLIRVIHGRVAIGSHGSGSCSDISSLMSRLTMLLADEADQSDVFGGVALIDSDPFGHEALAIMKNWLDGPGFQVALQHLAKPAGSHAWRAKASELHDKDGVIRGLARQLIQALGPTAQNADGGFEASSLAIIKGAAHTLSATGDDSDALLLERTVIATSAWAMVFFAFGVGPRACVTALGEMAVPEAQAALVRLQARFRTGDLKKRIAAALDATATRSGLSAGVLLERSVPDFGLREAGSKTFGGPALTVVIAVTVDGVAATWSSDGAIVKKLSPELKDEHASVFADVQAEVKALSAARTAQRARLETLLAEGRTWAPREWDTLYARHPVVSSVAKALLWQYQRSDGWTTFLGSEAPPGDALAIRLWHPLLANDEEVERWRDVCVAARIVQPFKQVFREQYVLTPAEEASGRTSARFAQHTVRGDLIFALMKGKGWQAKWVGAFSSGYSVAPKLVMAEGRFRVTFELNLADGETDLAVTGAVSFERLHGKSWRPIELAEVPPLVFSEAMRDVDLFVSVATIANDPQWRERRMARNLPVGAWDDKAFPDLTAVGEVRRAALERIVPSLKFGGRCTLDDRSLVVRGTLNEYRINLATANVMTSPGGRYLCIVQGAPSAARGVFLPFASDDLLALVISKAALLVNDHKITDPTIVRQLNG